jgi:hypothetical protein
LEPTRVLLVDIPRVLEEIIRAAFADDHDFILVAEGSSEPVDVAAAIDREGAGFVIVAGTRPERPEVFRHLLDEQPMTGMLALADYGRENFLYAPLGELSPHELAEAVRSTAARRRAAVG